MELKLDHISIEGFKGYKDRVDYSLDGDVLIYGDNGAGKSSIIEAAVYALTNCDINGNEKASARLVNNKKPKLTEVVLDFYLDGEKQTIVRRKKGKSNDLYWNENKVTNADIARDIFDNKELFLSIVNPYYFPSLAPKDAKQLLSSTLKPIGQEEIFKELGDYLVKVLKDNGFRIADVFMKDTRDSIKEHEDNLIFLEGSKNELKEVDVDEKKVFDEDELIKAKEELKKLNEYEGIEVKLSKLKKPNDYSSEISELRVQAMTAKNSLNNLSLQELLPVEYKKQEREYLLQDYKNKKATIDELKSNKVKCHECGTEIEVNAASISKLEKELEAIKVKGKNVKAEIEEMEAKNISITNNNKKIKSDKEKQVNEDIAKINIKMQDLLRRAEESKKIYKADVEAIKSENEEIEKEKSEKENFLKSKIYDLEEEKQKVFKFNNSIDMAIEHNGNLAARREEIDHQITNSNNKIAQLKLALDACKQYNSIKLKKQSEYINQYLNKVEITFESLTKDGEIKEDFKINYEGKEFNKLSNAEKIKAGLEISNLLINVKNMHLPIFIDNAESINVIPPVDTQIIQARVTDDKSVLVKVLKNE